MPQRLTFEQTRGTKTYHLPFKRDSRHGPEMTLMVRRLADGSFAAGVSVCSLREFFVKSAGRLLAYHRLNGKPLRGGDADELLGQVEIHLRALNENRPETVSGAVFTDLATIGQSLNQVFDQLDQNRSSRLCVSQEAGGC